MGLLLALLRSFGTTSLHENRTGLGTSTYLCYLASSKSDILAVSSSLSIKPCPVPFRISGCTSSHAQHIPNFSHAERHSGHLIGLHGVPRSSILTLSTRRMSTLKSAICIAVLLDIKVTFLPAIDKSNHKLVAKAMYEVRYIDLDDR
ncbi:hypothetical protein AAG906_015541 [Vitis piasezkii]